MHTLIFTGWATPHQLLNISKPHIIHKNIVTPYQPLPHITYHVIGFSMGCYQALDFIEKCADKVSKISFISFRPYYPKKEIALMQKNLNRNRRSTLIHFYKRAIAMKTDWLYFKHVFLDMCLRNASTAQLSDSLSWALSKDHYKALATISLPVSFYHSKDDPVAPLCELKTVIRDNDRLHTNQVAHLPFLNESFNWSIIL